MRSFMLYELSWRTDPRADLDRGASATLEVAAAQAAESNAARVSAE